MGAEQTPDFKNIINKDQSLTNGLPLPENFTQIFEKKENRKSLQNAVKHKFEGIDPNVKNQLKGECKKLLEEWGDDMKNTLQKDYTALDKTDRSKIAILYLYNALDGGDKTNFDDFKKTFLTNNEITKQITFSLNNSNNKKPEEDKDAKNTDIAPDLTAIIDTEATEISSNTHTQRLITDMQEKITKIQTQQKDIGKLDAYIKALDEINSKYTEGPDSAVNSVNTNSKIQEITTLKTKNKELGIYFTNPKESLKTLQTEVNNSIITNKSNIDALIKTLSEEQKTLETNSKSNTDAANAIVDSKSDAGKTLKASKDKAAKESLDKAIKIGDFITSLTAFDKIKPYQNIINEQKTEAGNRKIEEQKKETEKKETETKNTEARNEFTNGIGDDLLVRIKDFKILNEDNHKILEKGLKGLKRQESAFLKHKSEYLDTKKILDTETNKITIFNKSELDRENRVQGYKAATETISQTPEYKKLTNKVEIFAKQLDRDLADINEVVTGTEKKAGLISNITKIKGEYQSNIDTEDLAKLLLTVDNTKDAWDNITNTKKNKENINKDTALLDSMISDVQRYKGVISYTAYEKNVSEITAPTMIAKDQKNEKQENTTPKKELKIEDKGTDVVENKTEAANSFLKRGKEIVTLAKDIPENKDIQKALENPTKENIEALQKFLGVITPDGKITRDNIIALSKYVVDQTLSA